MSEREKTIAPLRDKAKITSLPKELNQKIEAFISQVRVEAISIVDGHLFKKVVEEYTKNLVEDAEAEIKAKEMIIDNRTKVFEKTLRDKDDHLEMKKEKFNLEIKKLRSELKVANLTVEGLNEQGEKCNIYIEKLEGENEKLRKEVELEHYLAEGEASKHRILKGQITDFRKWLQKEIESHEVIYDDPRSNKGMALQAINVLKMVDAYLQEKKVFGEEVHTHEGNLLAICGVDYIIKGVQGELYPIKKDVFEQTYEVVEAEKLEGEKKE